MYHRDLLNLRMRMIRDTERDLDRRLRRQTAGYWPVEDRHADPMNEPGPARRTAEPATRQEV
jgi:hypothetical protein